CTRAVFSGVFVLVLHAFAPTVLLSPVIRYYIS
ncbi:MAG: hypothetical protein ACJAVW_002668, partial [Spirosomataceae bacterium]